MKWSNYCDVMLGTNLNGKAFTISNDCNKNSVFSKENNIH